MAKKADGPNKGRLTPEEYISLQKKRFRKQTEATLNNGQENSFVPVVYQPTWVAGADDADDKQTVTDFCQSHQRFVVLGMPGIGKTKALEDVFHYYADSRLHYGNTPVPLWISLSDPRNPVQAEDLLQRWYRGYHRLGKDFYEALEGVPPILLFDGLNEMPLETRAERAESLREWISKHPHLPVVVTCRLRDYQDDSNMFMGNDMAAAEVLRFESEQIAAYVHQVIEDRYSAKKFMTQVNNEEAIFRLAQIPLHLSMLVQLADWQRHSALPLPTRLLELYQKYLEARYFWEKNKEANGWGNTRVNLEWEDLEERLRKLARRMSPRAKMMPFSWGTGDSLHKIKEARARSIMGAEALEDAHSLNIVTHSAAEINAGWGSNGRRSLIEFFHPSLHGYFALPHLIKALDDNKNNHGKLAGIIRQIGDLGDAAEVAVEPLIQFLSSRYEGEVQTTTVNALTDIGSPSVGKVIPCLANRDIGMSNSAVKILSHENIAEDAKVPLLIYALRHEDPLIRHQIGIVLEKIPRFPIKLVEAFQDPDSRLDDLRGQIAQELGESRSSRAVRPLIVLLEDDDYLVRGDAMLALGEIRDKSAAMPIIRAVTDEELTEREYMYLRNYAANALKKIGCDALVQLMRAMLDPNPTRVRYAGETVKAVVNGDHALFTKIYHAVNATPPNEQFIRDVANHYCRERQRRSR